MRLKILLPTEVLLEQTVCKVNAEAENGRFCLEPRHIDFVAALVPSILSYTGEDGVERFVGLDAGILVKCGREVSVSTPEAVCGDDPELLKQMLLSKEDQLDDRERNARSALARLEAGVAKRLLDFNKGRHHG
jgi:F-type H+-transporting ATPase subunit epsilon